MREKYNSGRNLEIVQNGGIIEAVRENHLLRFTTNVSGSTIKLDAVGTPHTPNLEYSLDTISWSPFTLEDGDYRYTVTLAEGQTVYLRGTNDYINSQEDIELGSYNHFSISGTMSSSGSIMSLIDYYGDESGTLGDYCMAYLFSDCENLTSSPELPAVEVGCYGYMYMFSRCTGLTTMPELPAPDLTTGCYYGMFSECSGLVNVSELTASILEESCYSNMFEGCTSLVTAPQLSTDTLAISCYSYMFAGCSSLVNAPELSSIDLGDSCYSYMFSGCTSLETAPELLAEYDNLKPGCYSHMFEGCTKLNYIHVGFDKWDDGAYTESWVEGAGLEIESGLFRKRPELEEIYGESYIPDGWEILDS